jgi:hypothetical protein
MTGAAGTGTTTVGASGTAAQSSGTAGVAAVAGAAGASHPTAGSSAGGQLQSRERRAARTGGCQTYQQCAAGVEVTLCTKQGGSHDTGDANLGWAMLKKHPMP